VKGDNALNVGQAQARYRGKTGFVAFALLITLLIVSVLVGISLHRQEPPTDNLANLVSFTCRPSLGNQTFTVDVAVNLTDNMDQDEAIRVAIKVYEGYTGSNARLPASYSWAVYMSEDGTWIVEFDNTYTITKSYCAPRGPRTRLLHVIFEVTINPFARTVVYRLV